MLKHESSFGPREIKIGLPGLSNFQAGLEIKLRPLSGMAKLKFCCQRY